MASNNVIQGDVLDFCDHYHGPLFHGVLCDPPYGLNFMGKNWDHGVPGQEYWEAIRSVCYPGAFLLAFGGTRTFHRLAVAIEDAGWEIRDTLMWVYGCVSEDTEILTTNGWGKYDEIKVGETIYNFDIAEGDIKKDKVLEKFIYDVDDELVNLKNDNTDQLITKNHKVILKRRFRKQRDKTRKWYKPEKWRWDYAGNIDNYTIFDLPLGSVYGGEISIGVDFASLLGWILSEGNFQKDTEAINIYQSSVNNDKVDIIRSLLDGLNIKYSEYKRKRKYKDRNYIEHQFYFSGDIVKEIKKWIPNKKPAYNLLDLRYEEKVALFNSLMMGTAQGKRDGKYVAFYQHDMKFLEWFQVLCHLIGMQARINEKKMCVNVHYNPTTQFQARHLKNRLVHYKGKAWSIRTNNMSYIARRNGKIFITGNSGFPKSLNIGKAVDKFQGNERDVVGLQEREGRSAGIMGNRVHITREISRGDSAWENYGTALKPAWEPIILAQNPRKGTFAENVLKYGCGGLNIDGCRVPLNGDYKSKANGRPSQTGLDDNYDPDKANQPDAVGRWPANLIHDGSDEVVGMFPTAETKATEGGDNRYRSKQYGGSGYYGTRGPGNSYTDSGSAARFFYCAKASRKERDAGLEGMSLVEAGIGDERPSGQSMQRLDGRDVRKVHNPHPTVKPVTLTEYLARLILPPKQDTPRRIFCPFAGSGSEMIGAYQAGWDEIVGVELEKEYCDIARARLAYWTTRPKQGSLPLK